MNAKGIKEEPYNNELKDTDLDQFRSRLEEISNLIQDPRTKDNQKHEFFTLLAIIFCAIVSGANSINAIHRYAIAKRNG